MCWSRYGVYIKALFSSVQAYRAWRTRGMHVHFSYTPMRGWAGIKVAALEGFREATPSTAPKYSLKLLSSSDKLKSAVAQDCRRDFRCNTYDLAHFDASPSWSSRDGSHSWLDLNSIRVFVFYVCVKISRTAQYTWGPGKGTSLEYLCVIGLRNFLVLPLFPFKYYVVPPLLDFWSSLLHLHLKCGYRKEIYLFIRTKP